MSTGRVTAITARVLVDQCVRQGISKKDLLQEIGLSPESMATPAGKIPISQMLTLWECIAKYTKDPMFLFRVAAGVPFGTYGVLDFMFAASATPQEALMRSSRCFGLVNDIFILSLRLQAGYLCLELHNAGASTDLQRAYAEYILMNYLVRLRFVTQADIRPIEVCLTSQSRCHSRESESGFNAPVRFGQPANCLVFPRHFMELQHPLADPELCEILEEHAKRRLYDSPVSPEPLAHIYQALAQNLKGGNLTLTFLARQLAKSPRSLQREIHEHGLTFRDIANRVRREYALALLIERNLPIKEIACMLQFADASAFCRAFRRWTGEWPLQYRNARIQHAAIGAS